MWEQHQNQEKRVGGPWGALGVPFRSFFAPFWAYIIMEKYPAEQVGKKKREKRACVGKKKGKTLRREKRDIFGSTIPYGKSSNITILYGKIQRYGPARPHGSHNIRSAITFEVFI